MAREGGGVLGKVLLLVIINVIALALTPTIATSATSASGNMSSYPAAQGMISIINKGNTLLMPECRTSVRGGYPGCGCRLHHVSAQGD